MKPTAEQIADSLEAEAARLIRIAAILRDTPATHITRRIALWIESAVGRPGRNL